MDQSALPSLTKIHIHTKLKFFCFFFTLIFGGNFFFIIVLVNYVRVESCREILAPTSPSVSDIIDAAIKSAHRCTI